MTATRRVVITGMGCLTPFGAGLEAFWGNLIAGRSGIGPLTAFDSSGYGTRIAGEIRGFEPADFLSRREISGTARCTQIALASSRMALDHAELRPGEAGSDRIGVFLGSSVGTFGYAAENYGTFIEKGIRRIHPLFPAQSYPGVIATQTAIQLGIRGPVMCVSSACTSSADSIGVAFQQIRSGIIDRAIVGGAETPLTPLLFASFDRLGGMSRNNDDPERASRPFSAGRDGFVMSEGAGAIILEAEELARERGAPVRAELAGYAATSDAYHPFSPLPTGDEGVRAVMTAMEEAGIGPRDVDYVNAHAIGSVPNDPVEIEILKRLFGEHAPTVPISAIKSMIGHSMGAASALELIACVRALETQTIPPTINLDPQDLEQGLDLVPDRSRSLSIQTATSTTFGFGSRNAALVVRCYEGD